MNLFIQNLTVEKLIGTTALISMFLDFRWGSARNRYILARVEFKIDALIKAAGPNYDPFSGIPPDVAKAILRGQKINAIRLLRKKSRFSLREAKDEVDRMEARLRM